MTDQPQEPSRFLTWHDFQKDPLAFHSPEATVARFRLTVQLSEAGIDMIRQNLRVMPARAVLFPRDEKIMRWTLLILLLVAVVGTPSLAAPAGGITGEPPKFPLSRALDEALIEEVAAPGGPTEVFALLSSFHFMEGMVISRESLTLQPNFVVRTWDDGRAELAVYWQRHAYVFRPLSGDELKRFRRLATECNVDALAPLTGKFDVNGCYLDYLHYSRRDGQTVGRRIPMQVPFTRHWPAAYRALVNMFWRMPVEKMRSGFEKQYEVLYHLPGRPVVGVSMQDARVCVWAPTSYFVVGGGGVDPVIEPRRNTWYGLETGGLGATAQSPPEYVPVGQSRKITDGDDVIAVDAKGTSILRYSAGHAKLIAASKEGFALPVASLDGRWLIAMKRVSAPVETLWKIRLSDGRKFEISRPGAWLWPVSWLPTSRRFLLRDVHGHGYFLLDPETDVLTPFVGEVRPLLSLQKRIPQQAAPNLIWTALPADDGTDVGTYDLQNFVFHRVAHYPGLYFEAAGMWVDVDRHCVLAPCQGDLLRLPLPADPAAVHT